MEISHSNSKAAMVNRLMEAKRRSNKTFSQIGQEIGVTNVYVAQLLRRQARLHPDTATKLKAALPGLSDDLLSEMMKPPNRSFDPNLLQEPAVYRLHEAVMHYGESIKEIINEEFGDGIMSAIDFYCSVDRARGVDGKERVVVTFDGKYLPFNEQGERMLSTSTKQEMKNLMGLCFNLWKIRMRPFLVLDEMNEREKADLTNGALSANFMTLYPSYE